MLLGYKKWVLQWIALPAMSNRFATSALLQRWQSDENAPDTKYEWPEILKASLIINDLRGQQSTWQMQEELDHTNYTVVWATPLGYKWFWIS